MDIIVPFHVYLVKSWSNPCFYTLFLIPSSKIKGRKVNVEYKIKETSVRCITYTGLTNSYEESVAIVSTPPSAISAGQKLHDFPHLLRVPHSSIIFAQANFCGKEHPVHNRDFSVPSVQPKNSPQFSFPHTTNVCVLVSIISTTLFFVTLLPPSSLKVNQKYLR